jgi:sec-independent protein translocase protein TatA
MGSLGLPEIIFILVLALLIFGPKRLPEIGRTLGKGMAEFRKATNDLKNTITTELSIEEEQPARPRRVDLASVAPIITPPAPRPLPAETVAQGAPAADAADAADAAGTADTPAYDELAPYGAPPAAPVAVAEAAAPAAPEASEPAHPPAPPVEPARPLEPS